MDGQMTGYMNSIPEESDMEPLDLSVHSSKRHSEGPGTFQERPLCLIKFCGCQNGRIHPHLPSVPPEHQASCIATSDMLLWKVDDPTRPLQQANETLNRPQSCPLALSTLKWSRLHGAPPHLNSDTPPEGHPESRVPKVITNTNKDLLKSPPSASDDIYPQKGTTASNLMTPPSANPSVTPTEDICMESESFEQDSQTQSDSSETPSTMEPPQQWRPLSPTNAVNRAPENYLNLMHHLLQGCSSLTDMSISVRQQKKQQHNPNPPSGGDQNVDLTESTDQENTDEEMAVDQETTPAAHLSSHGGAKDCSRDSLSSEAPNHNDASDREPSEDANNDTDSSPKKSPTTAADSTDLKAASVSKVNALDYLISKYLVQNVDMPYKPCNRKIRELLNNGETKICFMDLIELQIEKSFTVPG